VRQALSRALRLLVLPTFALVAVAVLVPGRLVLATRVYALVVCAVALGLALAALRRSFPAETPLSTSARRGSGGRRPPPGLTRFEQETALGVAGAFDLHYRFAPHLRSLAAGLLSSRRRISLEADPDSACIVLGEETWALVRRDLPAPEDRRARGVPAAALRRVVESLERV
jgi:hypothetical protein